MYLLKNVPIETFSISFESTQNKQRYGMKITCTEVRGKSYGHFKCDNKIHGFGGFRSLVPLLIDP